MVTVLCCRCALYFSSITRITSLKTLLLNDPHNPRSELITIMRMLRSGRTLLYHPGSAPSEVERFWRIAVSFWANGRICSTFSCERRSFAAATIFMAFVICCVDITDPIRFFTSFKLGISSCQVERYLLYRFQIGVFQFTGAEVVHDILVLRAHTFEEIALEITHLVNRNRVHKSAGRCRDDRHLFFNRHGRVLILLENFYVPTSAFDGQLRSGIQVGTEFRECFQFAELCLIEFERTGHFLHGLDLCRSSHARHRDTNVDRGTNT